jgi:NAD+ kinase
MTQILVVYKRSFLESHRQDRKTLSRLDPSSRSRYIRADIENRQTILDVFNYLSKKRVTFDILWRGSLARRYRYNLIVVVGGDGTFFAASHYVKETPMLGINSDPSSSLSLFSCCDRKSFREKLDRAIEGMLPGTNLNRMEIAINKKTLPTLAFNDVLFTHRNPAAMSRYTLAVDGKKESQRSSGIWISTASGSTAGIRAAGGKRMAITSKRLQYRVREPYTWPNPDYTFTAGYAQKQIALDVQMTEAALWLDGSRLRYDLELSDHVTLTTGAHPLLVLGYDDRRRCELFR